MQEDGAIRFDYSALAVRIEQRYGISEFALAMAMSPRRLARLLSGDGQLTQREIAIAVLLLEIPDYAVNAYFFTKKV